MRLLRKLLSGGQHQTIKAPAFDAPLRPEVPFFAIGDIHGMHDKLQAALNAFAEIADNGAVVCVGDFVDRGEQSADALRLLKAESDRRGDSFICLMGNHEEMLLKFLDNPERHGERWLRYGGLQTLASYGVGLGAKRDMEAVRDKLLESMGPEMVAWIRALPSFWVTGNVAVVHAGADPVMPIAHQALNHLLWGHPEFEATPRQDGMWVVHGHTIVDQPYAENGRIAVDTGAYATGRLTVAMIQTDDVEYLVF